MAKKKSANPISVVADVALEYQQEIAALKAELAHESEERDMALKDLADEMLEHTDTKEDLRAVVKFGAHHTMFCDGLTTGGRCNCGFAALLEARPGVVKAMEEKV